jgi:hypothetical protein
VYISDLHPDVFLMSKNISKRAEVGEVGATYAYWSGGERVYVYGEYPRELGFRS